MDPYTIEVIGEFLTIAVVAVALICWSNSHNPKPESEASKQYRLDLIRKQRDFLLSRPDDRHYEKRLKDLGL